MGKVSIHAPAWGATSLLLVLSSFVKFQSTRPHGARPPTPEPEEPALPVSIHAPAWGATKAHRLADSDTKFQSTRPHGARRGGGRIASFGCQSFNPRARMGRDALLVVVAISKLCFNPRARMGRDGVVACYAAYLPVSIHAPAWGATKTEKRKS